MTAYGAGLRVSEVVALRVGDIDSQRMLLRVQQGKGKKDRYAMLSPRLLEVLRACWRATHRQTPGAPCQAKPSPDEWFFHGWRQGRHMNVESLQTACREAARVAGLSKHVTVHTMRHYAEFRTMPSKSRPMQRQPGMTGVAGAESFLGLGIVRRTVTGS
jgi:integrase